jgi:hypothetical protein
MCRKLAYFIYIALIGVMAGNITAADIQYTDAGADHLWTNPENWKDAAGPPTTADDGAAFKQPDTIVHITEGMTAVCKGFMLGMYGVSNQAEISGGSLTCNWLNVGRANQKGGQGTLLVTGGEIFVNGNLNVPHQFTSAVDPEKIGIGHVDLLGGYIVAGNFNLGNRQTGQPNGKGGIGTMNMTEGGLYVAGDKTADIQDWIDKGWITAYNGSGEFELDYDVRFPGETSLTAFKSENRAQQPSPANNSTEVPSEVTLSWFPGSHVQTVNGHELYIGTTMADVNDATSDNHPNVEVHTLSDTSHGPVSLDLNKTYYWRVDQVNSTHPDKQWKGYVWNFAVAEHRALDDFESYAGNDLSDTWTAAGSATLALETSTIHAGTQAIKVDYTGAAVVSRELPGLDMTVNGIEALYIWCKADPDVDTVSVQLNNSGVKQTVSTVDRTSDWQLLLFDLSLFNVDVSSVNHIRIEINAQDQGAGTVYVDDIALFPCIPGGLAADFNGDCIVDDLDLEILMNDWLKAQYWP